MNNSYPCDPCQPWYASPRSVCRLYFFAPVTPTGSSVQTAGPAGPTGASASITFGSVADAGATKSIRAVAQLQDVPLFDRYSIMHSWNETGEFDLSNSSRSYALARGVHDCLGRALANLVIAAAKLNPAAPQVQQH